MTSKQQIFIEQLRDEMGMTDDEINDVVENLTSALIDDWGELSIINASLLIDELLQMKRRGDY